MKNAASFLTSTEPEEEVDVHEQSILSPGSSRSGISWESPIRDASIRPLLSVLREEQEIESEKQEECNSESYENHTKNLSTTVAAAAAAVGRSAAALNRDATDDDGQNGAASESSSTPVPCTSQDISTPCLSHSIGPVNRLKIPEDNLKRLKTNLSKRSRLSMPCSNFSASPPAKASRLEVTDSETTTRIPRNSSDFFKTISNNSLSSSFTFGSRSPFYDGKTSFGGSSSRRMSRLAFPYSMAGRKIAPVLKVRASEMVKSDSGKSEALSCASMKILDVINKESSLLEDSKKIPLNDSSGLSNRTVFNNFVKSSSSRRVSSTKTRYSMPHITTSVLNKSITSTHPQNDTSNSSSLDWRLNPNTFADDANVTREHHNKTLNSIQGIQESSVLDKVGGKMKSSLCKSSLSNRSSSKVIDETETVPTVDLPQISLPLKSLPSFNLEFKKSDTLAKDINQYKFSWPLTYSDSNRDLPKVNSTAKAFTFSSPSSKEISESSRVEADINLSNISTNVTLVTPSESTAISDASWSCPKCIYRNASQDIKCLVCETLKPDTNELKQSAAATVNTSKKTSNKVDLVSSSWGDKFKKAPGTWTCDICMVDNKAEDNKCVACETEKPGFQASQNPAASSSSSLITNTTTDSANVIVPNALSKKWTCDTCYVKNEENRDTCISCEMSRKTGDNSSKKANYSGYKFNLTEKSPPPFKFGFSVSSNTSTSTPSTIGFATLKPTVLKSNDQLIASTNVTPLINTTTPPQPATAASVATTTPTQTLIPTVTATAAATVTATTIAPSVVETLTPVTKSVTQSNPPTFTFGSFNNINSVSSFGISNTNGPATTTSIASAAAAASSTSLQPGEKTSSFSLNPNTPLNFSFGSNATSVPVSTTNGTFGSTGSFTFTGSTPAVASDALKGVKKDVVEASTPATKSLTFNPPNPSTFTFGQGTINTNSSVPSFSLATANGSNSTVPAPASSTAQPAATKTMAFNFNPTQLNFSFGANANSAPKFGVSTSNGSLGSTGSFTFTASAADPLRGENTSGRVVRKAKRRLPNPNSK